MRSGQRIGNRASSIPDAQSKSRSSRFPFPAGQNPTLMPVGKSVPRLEIKIHPESITGPYRFRQVEAH